MELRHSENIEGSLQFHLFNIRRDMGLSGFRKRSFLEGSSA